MKFRKMRAGGKGRVGIQEPDGTVTRKEFLGENHWKSVISEALQETREKREMVHETIEKDEESFWKSIECRLNRGEHAEAIDLLEIAVIEFPEKMPRAIRTISRITDELPQGSLLRSPISILIQICLEEKQPKSIISLLESGTESTKRETMSGIRRHYSQTLTGIAEFIPLLFEIHEKSQDSETKEKALEFIDMLVGFENPVALRLLDDYPSIARKLFFAIQKDDEDG